MFHVKQFRCRTAQSQKKGEGVSPVNADDENSVDAPTSAAIDFFGSAYPPLQRYVELLRSHGIERGLIGPRELPKLWDRHIMNCAALTTEFPEQGLIADVGSGAGLPGIVAAIMRPDAEFVLIETMERRVTWLLEVVEHLALTNVRVQRARAEDLDGAIEADVVTARAVAALDKLARWCFPLARVGGQLVLLKGERVHDEVTAARKVLRKYGADNAVVTSVQPVADYSAATVLRLTRTK